MNDVDALTHLLYRWDETRAWAEELICREFELEKASDVLGPRDRPFGPFGQHWHIRCHGNGVAITPLNRNGGIDFDFEPRQPDEWRLRNFMLAQLHEGKLTKKYYRPLLQDQARFSRAFEQAVTHRRPTHPLLVNILERVESLVTPDMEIGAVYYEGKTPRLVWSRDGRGGIRYLQCAVLEEKPAEVELLYCVSVPGLFARERRQTLCVDDALGMFEKFLIEWVSFESVQDLKA